MNTQVIHAEQGSTPEPEPYPGKKLLVLLVLEERARERRELLREIHRAQLRFGNLSHDDKLEPVDELARGGLFLEPVYLPEVVKNIHGVFDELAFEFRVMDLHYGLKRLPVREGDVVEEASPEEGVRELLLVIGRDYYNGTLFCAYSFLELVTVELHPVELQKQVVRKFYIGLVYLVYEQHHLIIGFECLPQLPLFYIIGNVVNPCVPELGIAEPGNGVVFIETLLSGRGRLYMPGNELLAEGFGHLEREHRLSRPGLTLNQERPLERDRRVDKIGRA